MLSQRTLARAAEILSQCREEGLKVATVESCTGGLLCAALTAHAGSSDVVEGGFITYSNEAKTAMVRVRKEQIAFVGAVSEDVAYAMAQGGLRATGADIVISITGVAGPGGGSEAKPVGLVHIFGIRKGGDERHDHERHVFPGDRGAVREASVAAALEMIARLAD